MEVSAEVGLGVWDYGIGWACYWASNALNDIRGRKHTAKPPKHWLESGRDAGRRYLFCWIEAKLQQHEAEGRKLKEREQDLVEEIGKLQEKLSSADFDMEEVQACLEESRRQLKQVAAEKERLENMHVAEMQGLKEMLSDAQAVIAEKDKKISNLESMNARGADAPPALQTLETPEIPWQYLRATTLVGVGTLALGFCLRGGISARHVSLQKRHRVLARNCKSSAAAARNQSRKERFAGS